MPREKPKGKLKNVLEAKKKNKKKKGTPAQNL
jgi:hypothetical protein